MNNVSLMQHLKPRQNLFYHRPNLFLVDPRQSLLLFLNQFLYYELFTYKSPPSASYITMHRVLDLESKKDSLYLMMKSELMEAKRRTSFNAFSFSFSLRLFILTFFVKCILF